MSISEVDRLLERYLHLLDKYSTLRSQLCSLQLSIYQDIARANFTAERGIRYGADSYDARMQATRLLRITMSPSSSPTEDTTETSKSHSETEDLIPTFTIALAAAPSDSATATEPEEHEPTPKAEQTAQTASAESPTSKNQSKSSTTPTPPPKPRDPLRQFGLLVPASLRSAQSTAIQLVETLVPQLASVDAEMRAMEIEVRRARKKARRAEKLAAGAAGVGVGSGGEIGRAHEIEVDGGTLGVQGLRRLDVEV